MSGRDLQQISRPSRSLESRLAAYVAAAGAAGTVLSSESGAAIVANTTPQNITINGDVNVDFNGDGYTDYQLDHDRYNLNGTDIDYLQIDKNDVNSAANPGPIDHTVPFPTPPGVTPNDNDIAGYLQADTAANDSFYPAALTAGDEIGPTPPGVRSWGFQESSNAFTSGAYRRHNRLIDEDKGQIDTALGNPILPPTDTSEWVGLNGETRYLGVRMDLNSASADDSSLYYGWIGVQITNEADATGVVTGWAYENVPNTPIRAGDTGPAVANADYDDDGDVDGNDFLVWQRAVGSSVANGTGADGNGNGVVDGPDLDLWETQYGSTVAVAAGDVAAAAVPEPGSMLMAGLCAALSVALVFTKRRQRRLAVVRCRA